MGFGGFQIMVVGFEIVWDVDGEKEKDIGYGFSQSLSNFIRCRVKLFMPLVIGVALFA